MRILLADDDAELRATVRLMLRGLGCAIEETGSGWELLHLLANDGPYDMVITDVRMPSPSGLQVVSMARVAGLGTPFLVITAFPDPDLRRALLRFDDVRLLEKPFSPLGLRAAVAATVRGE